MIKPINDNILIKIDEVREVNGIALPENSSNINEKGEVLEVGEDVKKIKKGDTIIFKSWAIDTAIIDTTNDEKVSFVKEENVLGIKK